MLRKTAERRFGVVHHYWIADDWMARAQKGSSGVWRVVMTYVDSEGHPNSSVHERASYSEAHDLIQNAYREHQKEARA